MSGVNCETGEVERGENRAAPGGDTDSIKILNHSITRTNQLLKFTLLEARINCLIEF